MTPEEQAKALSEWLEQPPGSPPPEGIDKEVLETIYVFQPERAPAAKVSIEDILQLVESGPFLSETPKSTNKAGIVVLSEERRKRRRFWSGAGAIAAAAAVLIIALPQQDDAAQIGPQMVPSPVDEQTFSAPLPTATEAKNEKKSLKVKEKDSNGPPPIAQPDSQQNMLEEAPKRIEAEPSDLVGILDSTEEAPLQEIGSIQIGAASGAMEDQLGFGGSMGQENLSKSDAFVEYEEEQESAGAIASPTPAPAARSRSRRLFQQSEGKQQAAASSSNTDLDFEDVDVAEAEPQAAEPLADEPQEAALEQNQAQSTTALEALALPSDYLPPPEGIENQVPTQWEIAERAKALMIENKPNEALSMAAAALSLSSKNTPELSMLHYIIGRTSRQLNQDSAARTAYEKAIALNALR